MGKEAESDVDFQHDREVMRVLLAVEFELRGAIQVTGGTFRRVQIVLLLWNIDYPSEQLAVRRLVVMPCPILPNDPVFWTAEEHLGDPILISHQHHLEKEEEEEVLS
jgi:hypothetical protein